MYSRCIQSVFKVHFKVHSRCTMIFLDFFASLVLCSPLSLFGQYSSVCGLCLLVDVMMIVCLFRTILCLLLGVCCLFICCLFFVVWCLFFGVSCLVFVV